MIISSIFETSVDSCQWVQLDLRKAEVAKEEALREPTLERFKQFCQDLRSSKLRFRSEDRQERGAFDDGAGLLIEWADEVIDKIASMNDETLLRVEGGIREHRAELAEHVNTPIGARKAID